MTRKEIVEYLKLNKSHVSPDYKSKSKEDIEDFLDYLIDEFSDNNLKYNSESGFFDYVGPELPA